MKKYKFSYSRGWNDTIEDFFEYEDEPTQDELNQDFEEWVWNIIGDNCWVEEVDNA